MIARKNHKSDDSYPTVTSELQFKTENLIGQFLDPYRSTVGNIILQETSLKRYNHTKFLTDALERLSKGYTSLDCSRPWLVFWILNPLDLLDSLDSQKYSKRVIDFLSRCENKRSGGYGGGPSQLPHLATTYASINALSIIGTNEAYESIDKERIYKFLVSMKHRCGGFIMHEDGELDIRGIYCALSVATLLGIVTDELIKGVEEYVISLQTYEGGFSSIGNSEAHGGYSFCGIAIMLLLSKYKKNKRNINLDSLIHWGCSRQMNYEGGFQGRTNKLVDSCYSFWVGGIFPLINVMLTLEKKKIGTYDLQVYDYCCFEKLKDQEIMTPEEEKEELENLIKKKEKEEKKEKDMKEKEEEEEEIIDFDLRGLGLGFAQLGGTWLFDQGALQEYLLLVCQQFAGFVDKPGKFQDIYHTSYSLSGLSVSQNNVDSQWSSILGIQKNKLKRLNPIFNLPNYKVKKILKYFTGKESF